MMSQQNKPEPGPTAASTTFRRAHIDTSLHVELSKEERKSLPVRAALAGFGFTSTSSYARKEYKAAWLRDLGWLYEKSRSAKSYADINRAIEILMKCSHQHRRVQRCLSAITKFLTRPSKSDSGTAHQPEELPDEVWICRFRAHLAEAILGAYTEFDRRVTHVFDGTKCIRARERPTECGGSIDVTVPKCKRGHSRCQLRSFFLDNAASFSALADAIDAELRVAHSTEEKKRLEELKSIRDKIRMAQDDPGSICESDSCSKLGDAIIAIDGVKHTDVFAANNDKEWKLIAATFAKQLLNPVAAAAATLPRNPAIHS